MAKATYKLYLDLNDDRTFEAGEDITQYVIRAEWSLGMAPWDVIANNGEMTLILNNADRRFSPENTASPYYDAATGETKLMPLRGVRLTMNTGSGETIMWTGTINSLDVMPGSTGERRATLRCIDNMALVQNRNLIGIETLESKRSDQVIIEILNLQSAGSWYIGVPNASEIGVNTYLGGPRFGYTKIRTGQRSFTYAGDDWYNEETVYGKALEDVTRSEGWPARFFFDREGDAVFWDTDYLQALNDTPLAFDADNEANAMGYQHGAEVFNEVILRMSPRVEGSPATVLYKNEGSPIRLSANGGNRTIRAPFVDESNNRIGASTVIQPVEGTDFTMNTAEDGSGDTYTTGFEVSVIRRGDYADIALQNDNGVDLYVIGLQLRGTPLKHFNPTDIKARNNLSVSKYGLRQLQYSAPLLDDVEVGTQIANYMVNMRGVPRSEVAELTIDNGTAPRLGYIENKSIGDAISLSETQTALSNAPYIIIGEKHVVIDGGTHHLTTWRVEPTTLYRTWLIGVSGRSEIGINTFLGI